MRSLEPEPTVPPAPWGAVVALAERQEGVLRRDDLLRLGYHSRVIRRLLASHRLHERHPGVYTLGHRLLSPHGRLLAALWWCGGDAVVSHQSAAAFAGWMPHPDVVHLTTLRELPAPVGVRVHTTRVLPGHHVRVRAGRLPMTDWARTLIDLADALSYPELRRVADQLPELPLAQLRTVRAELAGRHGSGRSKRLLESEEIRTKSELERRFIRYCTRHGVPHPTRRNHPVADHKADCVYERECLVVELDGRAHHQRRAQIKQDHRRDADYQLAGYRILRLTWEETALDDGQAADTIRAFLRLGTH